QAPDAPAPPKTYEDALRSALRGWDIKRSGQSGWQCSRGNDRLIDEGDRVRAKNGSPAEVEGMFAVARAKNWQSMAFSGSEAFKRNVMETALRSGLHRPRAVARRSATACRGYARAPTRPSRENRRESAGARSPANRLESP